jgi:hypothetical protein
MEAGCFYVVGVAGFEPTTSSSRTKHATKLRHTPREATTAYRTAGVRSQTRMSACAKTKRPWTSRDLRQGCDSGSADDPHAEVANADHGP